MHLPRFFSKCISGYLTRTAALVAAAATLTSFSMPVLAAPVSEAVTSSELDAEWPAGPSVSSETAILIEASTGTILYAKDAHKQMYPASITKILTTLIATEECALDEQVTFTAETLATIPYDSSRIWVDDGEYLPMEDCLAAILIVSANDVAAGVAEHISGSLDAFADLMNQRAAELGCLNSHFVNAHGYHDPGHFTTAYDMAQIGRAFFENDLLCSLARERSFKIDASEGQPDDIWEFNKNQLLETRAYEYEYLVGSKTGYTDKAGQTLVSCAQKDGMKLICVVMNAKTPNQYKDTVTLFDFGFSNFTTANIYENDKTYVAADSTYGVDVADVLGNSSPLLNMDRDSIIVLPKTASFEDTTSYITMGDEGANCIATAHYQYGSHDIGSAQIYVTSTTNTIQENIGALEQVEQTPDVPKEEPSTIYVNVKKIALIALPCIAGIFILFWGYRLLNANYRRKHSTVSRRGISRRFYGIKNIVRGFCNGITAIRNYFKNCIKNASMRTRYKKRSYTTAYPAPRRNQTVDFDLKNGRTRSNNYYKNSTDLKTKDVVFHDLKK